MRNVLAYPKHALSSLFIFTLFIVSCTKNPPVQPPPPPEDPNATGTLQASDGSCMPATVHGVWRTNVNFTDSNYVEIDVNVTKRGNYHIYTDTVLGVSFSDTGHFDTAGVRRVRLKATGLLKTSGPTVFIAMWNGGSSCGFTINVTQGPLPDNSWVLTVGGKTYSGTGHALVGGGGADYTYDFTGVSSSSSDTTVIFRVRMPYSLHTPVLGTYYTSNPGARFFMEALGVPFITATGTGGPVLTIALLNNDILANGDQQTDGTIKGTATDANGNVVQVDGKFRAGAE